VHRTRRIAFRTIFVNSLRTKLTRYFRVHFTSRLTDFRATVYEYGIDCPFGCFRSGNYSIFSSRSVTYEEAKQQHLHISVLFATPPKIDFVVEERKTNVMSLAILFHFFCVQHVSDINISIIRILRLFC